jgi:formylglycine-generating enzyme
MTETPPVRRACCSPARDLTGQTFDESRSPRDLTASKAMGSGSDSVPIPAGSFLMGNDSPMSYPSDGEGPVREVTTSSYSIDRCAVSNADFERFVQATGHVTEAEREGWSFVFAGLLPDDFPATRGVAAAPWWREVEGADWRHPEGPQSEVTDRRRHPVVHVTWHDAAAYSDWSGGRLPTEAEWERAARGGLTGKLFPWGDEREPEGRHRMNVWQGVFPGHNTAADGWLGTCPVDEYESNAYGLYNMTGNVWEWCADWFTAFHEVGTRRTDPGALETGSHRVTKGGSYLCHASYCHRYRVAARSPVTPDTMCGNIGFRCVRDLAE